MPKILVFTVALLSYCCLSAQDLEYDDHLPLNKIRVLGSHNSYRKITDKKIWNWINFFGKFVKGDLKPAQMLEYHHLPLDSQLEYFGMRKFELDIYYDPDGGRYYKQQGNALVGRCTKSNVDALLWSGMKLLHIPDVDYNTHYYTFRDALQTIKTWSVAHPTHVPIYIMVELKDKAIRDYANIAVGFKKALPFDEKAIDDLTGEIFEIFDTAHILKPDDVRGNYPTLREAVTQKGFPLLKEVRGKVVFILLAGAETREMIVKNAPSFRGLPFFVYGEKSCNSPESAFISVDDAVKEYDKIEQAVKAGFIVRTRADAETREARENDYSTFETAKKSGAQILSTDYYVPYKTGYVLNRKMLLK